MYLWLGFCVLVFLAMFGLYLYQSPPKTEYTWVQYGPEDSWIARVITSAKTCPSLTVDQKDYPMSMRGTADAETEVVVCELAFPKDAREVSLHGTVLPIPRLHARKILVIGDTGCKLKGKHDQQCDIPEDWVFPDLAKVAAETNPDLIIHVGDYLYREEACPQHDPGCKGSPWGYNWKTLEADFFAPAKPLLTKAPWIFLRGNHESCNRAGKLWFRFQDAYPYQVECMGNTDPFLVNLANVQLLTVDSSLFYDYAAPQEQVQQISSQLANLPLNDNYWLITHRPLWGIKVMEDSDLTTGDPTNRLPAAYETALLRYNNGRLPSQRLVTFNDTLQKSFNKNLLDKMGLSFSGHFHNFEMLNFGGALPPQLIAGNTSTELEKEITASLSGVLLAGKPITNDKFYRNFGYLLFEEEVFGVWNATEYSPDGQKIFSCKYKDRNVICDQ